MREKWIFTYAGATLGVWFDPDTLKVGVGGPKKDRKEIQEIARILGMRGEEKISHNRLRVEGTGVAPVVWALFKDMAIFEKAEQVKSFRRLMG